MKTDKELLQLAARAVGVAGDYVENYWPTDYYAEQFYTGNESGVMVNDSDYVVSVWNPLESDGDALRLAVDLDIDLSFDADNGTIQAAYWIDSMNFAWKEESTAGDKHAATRRAITRAAAAIGEDVK